MFAEIVMYHPNPVIARIDLKALAHNLSILRSLIPDSCKICPVVKCNAYGHGLETIFPALTAAGADMMAVANLEEALLLKNLSWQKPTIVFGSQFSMYSDKDKQKLAEWIVENEIRITINDCHDIDSLAVAAQKINQPVYVHLMLDSGMCRMGLTVSALYELIDYIARHPLIHFEGLYTHLATADEADKTFAYLQLRRFQEFVAFLNNG